MNLTLPETINSGDEVEVQLAPRGAFPQIVDGQEVRQLVDDDAIKSLIDTFDKEVLVDADHDSETGRGTEAMAWVTKVFDDPDRGLVGIFKFTDKGADAVTNRRYRFISPAWTLDEKTNRPIKLVSVGMTNKPNLPVAPVLNMRACSTADAGAASLANNEGGKAAKAVNNDGEPSPSELQKGNPKMDKIKELLGLPVEATDEEVTTAIQALITKCGEADGMAAVNEALGLEATATNEDAVTAINALKQQCGDLQQAQNEAAADQFVSANEDVACTPEEKEELKNAYLADPETAEKTVANARAIAARIVANNKTNAEVTAKKVVNASVAKKPVVVNSVLEGLNACKTIAEQQAYIKEHAGQF